MPWAATSPCGTYRTPYVAFCDDDSWWEPGSVARAQELLDRHERLATVTARIVVEPGGTEDPIVAELRDSPIKGPAWLPGPALGSFLAGATVLRTDAAFAGIPWVIRERRVVAPAVERRLVLLETEQRHSTARQYVG